MANTINYAVVVDVITKEGYNLWQKGVEGVNKSSNRTKQTLSELRNNLLSTMFAGMAMARLFGGQIDRVAELTGTKDIIKAFFTTALVEPLSDINKKLAELLKNWNDLEPATKKLVGWLMIGITAAGVLLGTLSAIGLAGMGLAGVGKALGSIATIISTIGFGSLIAGLIIVMVLVATLYMVFKYNLGGMRDTAKAICTDIYDIFAGLFTMDAPRILHGFGSLFVDTFVGATIFAAKVLNAFVHAFGTILAILPGISLEDIFDSFGKWDTKLSELQKQTFQNVHNVMPESARKPSSFANVGTNTTDMQGQILNNLTIPKIDISVNYGSDINNNITRVVS